MIPSQFKLHDTHGNLLLIRIFNASYQLVTSSLGNLQIYLLCEFQSCPVSFSNIHISQSTMSCPTSPIQCLPLITLQSISTILRNRISLLYSRSFAHWLLLIIRSHCNAVYTQMFQFQQLPHRREPLSKPSRVYNWDLQPQ